MDITNRNNRSPESGPMGPNKMGGKQINAQATEPTKMVVSLVLLGLPLNAFRFPAEHAMQTLACQLQRMTVK